MSVNNPTIPGLIRPVVPTSVPFVYRDGLTMLQLIECIKHNLDDLQAYVNGVMDNVNKALEDQTTQNQDTLDKAQQAAQDAADAIQQAQDALARYQQIVANVNTALTTANEAISRLEALGVTSMEDAETLKTTIDQTKSLAETNKSNIASLESILNAAGVESVDSATRFNEGTKFILERYKTDSDSDYTNAWGKVMAEISDGGTIVLPSNKTISGTFVITKKNVTVLGGVTSSPITINVEATNDSQSGCVVDGVTFTGDYGIELVKDVGSIITRCTFNVNVYAIYSETIPEYNQQIRQTIITGNSIYSKNTGIYVAPKTPNSYYLGADFIITSNKINALIQGIHLEYVDGANISDNICFLSLGSETKTDNIYMRMCSYSIIADNELFEAGTSGIYVLDVERVKIDNNQIVWPGQYQQVAGIRAEVASKDANRYYTITNNTIENGSGDGIYTNAQLCTIANNQIMYPGSDDHWKGTGSITGEHYGINATGANGYYNIKGNYTIGESINNIPKLQGVSDNIIYSTQLDYNASNMSTYYKYFPHFVARGVTTKEEITGNKYSQGQITSFIVQNNAITVTDSEFLSNIDIKWGPLLAIVSCYNNGSLTIGDTTIAANQSKMLLLYAGQVREL